jgi:hypothetical protein
MCKIFPFITFKSHIYLNNVKKLISLQNSHCFSVVHKTILLMLFREKIAFYFETYKEYTRTCCGKDTQFHNFNAGGSYCNYCLRRFEEATVFLNSNIHFTFKYINFIVLNKACYMFRSIRPFSGMNVRNLKQSEMG